jgi:hypothetical protein
MGKIWYRQPAAEWNEALPIGNGRLGGMIFGKAAKEKIQLNEDSVWYGGTEGTQQSGCPSASSANPPVDSGRANPRCGEACSDGIIRRTGGTAPLYATRRFDAGVCQSRR